MARSSKQERVKRLTEHLKQENPDLARAVAGFQKLDRIARKLGLLEPDESLATQVSWWPVISVLGTFSAGKSTFINQYLGQDLQRTGNQAVDDKFTVICFGAGDSGIALPGLALDSDPRFPFYQISHDISRVAEGEGRGVDSYLQLKTSKAEKLRGKILIDSPGFDADKQRNSTLLITDHIIDLSDLVLVFFDARHPEPGAMADTLDHLVSKMVNRPDSTKFLYILNQIDNAARDDNSEEVVAAWQRALAQYGLTAGRFYTTYARSEAVPTEDEQVRERLERKCKTDMEDIEGRIQQVEVERAYRVAGVLEHTARHIESDLMPVLTEARRRWRTRTGWLSATVFGALGAGFLWWGSRPGNWERVESTVAGLDQEAQLIGAVVVLLVLWFIYSRMRQVAGGMVMKKLASQELGADREPVLKAFAHNLRAWWHPLTSSRPRGWSRRRRRQLDGVLAETDAFVQSLNDGYANPSG